MAPPAADQIRPGILSAPKAQNQTARLSGPGAERAVGVGVGAGAAENLSPAVRFSSVTQEIEPRESFLPVPEDVDGITYTSREISAEAQEALRALSQSLQRHRTSNFAFEPVSLPSSRVPSREGTPRLSPRIGSPALGTFVYTAQSPPLTPTELHSHEVKTDTSRAYAGDASKLSVDIATMTPQVTPPQASSSLAEHGDRKVVKDDSRPPTAPSSRPPTPSAAMAHRSTTGSTSSTEAPSHSAHRAKFMLAPSSSAESIPTPPEPGSGQQENYTGSDTSFTRPRIVPGEKDDPYARSKRPPPVQHKDAIDARFVFGIKDWKRSHGVGHHSKSSPSLPRTGAGGAESRMVPEKRHSFGFRRDHQRMPTDDNSHGGGGGGSGNSSKSGSMSDLKRFFGLSHKSKRSQSPAKPHKSGSRTPPHQLPQTPVPFADDHGLTSKYGKFGKVLGSGAGGSVRLMKRSTDGVTFAVKEFRPRHAHESEKEYAKKVTAEFCIGSTLHHGNIIETLDIVHEKGKWYEVMEYAPFDLFTIVMTGKMSRDEITCTFLQIFAGVTYLHSMGLAHRDLKLDNVVVNERGIMKIIDFGSATVFRYPFESDIVLAQGIVGSDPYLAPEVYDNNKYDPQPTDIWSLAVIFCCMSLRRFPWKVPLMSDTSFRLFASLPSDAAPSSSAPRPIAERPKSTGDLPGAARHDKGHAEAPPSPYNERNDGALGEQHAPSSSSSSSSHHHNHHHHHHHHHHQHDHHRPESHSQQQEQQQTERRDGSDGQAAAVAPPASPNPHVPSGGKAPEAHAHQPQQQQQQQQPAVVKGPWRLLRLLPRDSRNIIGRMLELDPARRATLEEMLAEPWIARSPVCRQEVGGRVVSAPGHTHTLEAPTDNAGGGGGSGGGGGGGGGGGAAAAHRRHSPASLGVR